MRIKNIIIKYKTYWIWNNIGTLFLTFCYTTIIKGISPLIASADSCSFFFLLLLSSSLFFQIFPFSCNFIGYVRLCVGMHGCAWVSVSVHGCARVFAGVDGYSRVYAGVCGCAQVCAGVWDEFSEFLLENRVPTSADFNTYPIRIF